VVPADFDSPVHHRRHAGSHRRPVWRRLLAMLAGTSSLRYLQSVSPRGRSGYPLHSQYSSLSDD
jgi:hypothetical protein